MKQKLSIQVESSEAKLALTNAKLPVTNKQLSNVEMLLRRLMKGSEFFRSKS